ncbi:MAG: ParB/RepB/Spo0J family partition protein [Acidobacteria bacterium]|nr:ParB/RepB/Spo0J family partition protein [Acidobacteriota bacterium]MYG74518.1 ParB/RepB/Spo0J family partition protein [Acidobacteriota bacterium]
MKRRGLGRGLDALLPSAGSTDGSRSVPVGELVPNPAQPRSQIADEDLEGLTASIAARGVIEPIVVRPQAGRFQIIAGERRWRAARLAGLERVPVVVRDASDEDVGLLALVENLQREDLNPIEEALAFRRLADAGGMTHGAIASEVGRSRTAVTNTLRLLELTPHVRRLVETGKLRAAAGRALVPLDAATQAQLAEEIVRGDLSVREVERRVKRAREGTGLAPANGPRPSGLDPNTRDAQERMQRAVGFPVRIRRRGKGGAVQIQFFSEDDLHRIFVLLTSEREVSE